MTTTLTRPAHLPTPTNRYLHVKLHAVARGRAASRIAEACRMARGARAQVGA